MAVKMPDETTAPEWTTIEQVFAALEAPLLAYARRLLGDQQAFAGDAFLQGGIFRRIDHVDAARDHADGAGFNRSDMRSGIDPARESGHYADALLP